MAYRLTFSKISSRSDQKLDRGYEIDAVRYKGTAIVRLSGILADDVRLALVAEAFLEGLGHPDEKTVDDLMLLFTVTRFEQDLRSGSIALSAGEALNSSLKFDVGRDDFSEIYSGFL